MARAKHNGEIVAADDAEALTPDWEVESLVPFVSGDHTWEAWTPLTSHYTRAEAEAEVAAIIAESPNSWPLRISHIA